MENILKFIPKIINGIVFASYEIEGFLYRAEPIKRKQDIVIMGMSQGQTIRVDLTGQLKHDLLVTSIDADLKEDDGKTLQLDRRGNYDYSYAQIISHVIDRKTNKVVKVLTFFISSYPSYTNQIVLSPDYIYELVANQDINSITFTGEPVHKPAPIIVFGQPTDTPTDKPVR